MCGVITEENNVMVNSKELINTKEYRILQMKCHTTSVITGLDCILLRILLHC